MRPLAVAVLLSTLLLAGSPALSGPLPEAPTLVSATPAGAAGNGRSRYSAVSADGAVVAFASLASDLVAGDTNGVRDVFVRDLALGTTERVSVGPAGAQSDGNSDWPALSADGRYVAFTSAATTLVAGVSGTQVYLRDRVAGTTELVSQATGGAAGDSYSGDQRVDVSADGRYVAFQSHATNLVAGDTNGAGDIFLRDRAAGTTARVSVGAGGAQLAVWSTLPSVSDDGSRVLFWTRKASPDWDDWKIVLRDVAAGTTATLADSATGHNFHPLLSADGQVAAWQRFPPDLLGQGAAEIVSVDLATMAARVWPRAADPYSEMAVTSDGRFVAFAAIGAPGPGVGPPGLYVWDRSANAIDAVVPVPGLSFPALADGASAVAYDSESPLSPGDGNGQGITDVYLERVAGLPGIPDLC